MNNIISDLATKKIGRGSGLTEDLKQRVVDTLTYLVDGEGTLNSRKAELTKPVYHKFIFYLYMWGHKPTIEIREDYTANEKAEKQQKIEEGRMVFYEDWLQRPLGEPVIVRIKKVEGMGEEDMSMVVAKKSIYHEGTKNKYRYEDEFFVSKNRTPKFFEFLKSHLPMNREDFT